MLPRSALAGGVSVPLAGHVPGAGTVGRRVPLCALARTFPLVLQRPFASQASLILIRVHMAAGIGR